MTTLDYETIEIYLGDRLRSADCLDVHADHFFPVTLLDRLFHYSEDINGHATDDRNRMLHRNFHGHDFDRWIDNLVARTALTLSSEEGIERIDLIDIDSMTVGADDDRIIVALPDETEYTLLTADGTAPLRAPELDRLTLSLDLANLFERAPVDADSERYMGFGMIAHVVRTVCEKSAIDPAKVDARQLSDRIFAHFKDELLPLIPSLWNDMEHILHYTHPTLHTLP